MRHALVENETNIVVNVILWDGAEWLPPRNHLVIKLDDDSDVGIGHLYDPGTNTFSKPVAS